MHFQLLLLFAKWQQYNDNGSRGLRIYFLKIFYNAANVSRSTWLKQRLVPTSLLFGFSDQSLTCLMFFPLPYQHRQSNRMAN